MQCDIRTDICSEKDAEGIYKISKQCFGDNSWSMKTVKSAVCGKYSHVIMAHMENSSAIIGFLSYTVIGGDEISIDDIAVVPSARRCGAADKMMQFLFRKASEEEIKKITLEVRESNTAAMKLYEKYGFKKTGLRKNYYRSPAENAVLMDSEIEI